MPWRPPWETNARDTWRASFDEDAQAYDRVRPVAPGSVFDDLIDVAGLRPGSSILEIGPGTGQATRPLAERGLRIRALELGAHLAERARQNVASFPDVEVVTTPFEAWDPGSARFDAVFACNSFHWVDPAIRFEKSAALLRPGGHLIVLSTPWVLPDDADQFWWDVQDDYAAIGAERVDPATRHPDRIDDLGSAVRASVLFEEPRMDRHLFPVTFTADDYAVNLSTQSGIKEFPPDARSELIDRIRRRVVARGGTVTAHLLAVLTVARLRAQVRPTTDDRRSQDVLTGWRSTRISLVPPRRGCKCPGVPENHFGEDVAARYDASSASMFDPEVLGPTIDLLAELAGDGAALEFAVGTGRAALPLAARGVPVSGIELSTAMADQLGAKDHEHRIEVTIGDMATTRVGGSFRLVYLVFNTIGNLTTQDEQVACFANAAAHLELGGCFVIEVVVPDLRRLPPGEDARVFSHAPGYVGYDRYTDVVAQQATSHHFVADDSGVREFQTPFRYVWPSELDLMARLAGLSLRDRWAGWDRSPFTGESTSHVSVWEKTDRPGVEP